jgi:hypothetical protein
VTTTIRVAGSIPASVNAFSYARRWTVGLQRAAGLAGHHDDGAVELLGDGGRYVVGVAGVEHGQRYPGGRADDLWSEGRPTHTAEHDVVGPDARELVAQRRRLADQGPRAARQVDPGQPDLRLGLGLRAP